MIDFALAIPEAEKGRVVRLTWSANAVVWRLEWKDPSGACCFRSEWSAWSM